MRVTVAARNTALAAIIARLDTTVPGPAHLQFMSGTAPTDVNDASLETVLADVPLPAPSFTAPVDGTADSVALAAPVPHLADGVCGWFRLLDGADTVMADGTVGITGSGADLIVSTTTFVIGAYVSRVSASLVAPESC